LPDIHDLRDCEHGKADDDQRNAVAQVHGIECQPVFAGGGRRANGSEQQPEAAGREALQRAGSGQHADHGQRENHQH
jgi:hypothetical protein